MMLYLVPQGDFLNYSNTTKIQENPDDPINTPEKFVQAINGIYEGLLNGKAAKGRMDIGSEDYNEKFTAIVTTENFEEILKSINPASRRHFFRSPVAKSFLSKNKQIFNQKFLERLYQEDVITLSDMNVIADTEARIAKLNQKDEQQEERIPLKTKKIPNIVMEQLLEAKSQDKELTMAEVFADPDNPINTPEVFANLVNGNYKAIFNYTYHDQHGMQIERLKASIDVDFNSREYDSLFNIIIFDSEHFNKALANVSEEKRQAFLESPAVVYFLMEPQNKSAFETLMENEKKYIRNKYDDLFVNTVMSYLNFGNLGSMGGLGYAYQQGDNRDHFFNSLKRDDYNNLPQEKKNIILNAAIEYFRGAPMSGSADVNHLVRLASYLNDDQFHAVLEGTDHEKQNCKIPTSDEISSLSSGEEQGSTLLVANVSDPKRDNYYQRNQQIIFGIPQDNVNTSNPATPIKLIDEKNMKQLKLSHLKILAQHINKPEYSNKLKLSPPTKTTFKTLWTETLKIISQLIHILESSLGVKKSPNYRVQNINENHITESTSFKLKK